MSSFLGAFSDLANKALTYGIKSVPAESLLHNSRKDNKQVKAFRAACHRGFEKAQRQALDLIVRTRADSQLAKEEKIKRELLVRKVIDAVAYTLLMKETHVMRRLSMHDYAPGIDISVVKMALAESERLNAESRQTFALVCDLTTFVHVGDLLRIDCRKGKPKIEIIELKSGRINSMLMDQLRDLDPMCTFTTPLNKENGLPPSQRRQAKRIHRQLRRMAQVQEVLATDKGIDIGFDAPIHLAENHAVVKEYDEVMQKMCDQAVAEQLAGGTIQGCIHIGIGYDEDTNRARESAKVVLSPVLYDQKRKPTEDLKKVAREFDELIPADARYQTYDLLKLNLSTVPCKPFICWELDPEHVLRIADGRLCILASFDVIAFVWLARELGVDMRFSSRPKATGVAKKFGKYAFPTWGGRALVSSEGNEETILGGGILNRLLNDLVCPASVIQMGQPSSPTVHLQRIPFSYVLRSGKTTGGSK